jgi:DNA-binding transcriptional regulator YhcF (GntR family)
MRFDKPMLTVREFAQEVGYHVNTVKRNIIEKGKLTIERSSPRAHIRITREEADLYRAKHRYKATAYGKAA